jgi:hypothetical protein
MFQKKPWSRKYLLDALRGFPPDRTHLAYWEFVDGPIGPFNRVELVGKNPNANCTPDRLVAQQKLPRIYACIPRMMRGFATLVVRRSFANDPASYARHYDL